MTKSTDNYKWFKFLANNRKISKKHLNNLRKQFEEFGNITEISPITVNVNGFILDGQHRRILCEELGYPVFYNEVDVKKEITPAMNTNQKPWQPADYIDFFAAYKPEYELLSRFMRDNETNFYLANAAIFPDMSRKKLYEKLKRGELEVTEYIVEGQKRMDVINEVSDIMQRPITEVYARTILKCMYKENFDINRFLNKLKMLMAKHDSLPQPRATTTIDVFKNIEAIYNFGARAESTVVLFR
jgi:hypothetical protein